MRHWKLPALILAPTVLIFAGFEVVERTWLQNLGAGLRHAVHIVRGIVATLVVSGLVAWVLTRHETTDLPRKIPPSGEPVDYVDWFIRLRWLALLGVATAVVCSQHVLHLLPGEVTAPLWGGVALLLLSNAVYIELKRKVRSVRVQLRGQLITDLLILTCLLHLAGGLENPFLVVCVFPVILASIVLPKREAYAVAAGAGALILALAFGEYAGVFKHYTITLYPHVGRHDEGLVHAAHRLPFVLGVAGSMIALMSGTAYFTAMVVDRLRESHRHLLRSERLSALGQLVAYVAHEVNNPLGIISTRAKLARSRAAEPDSSAFLQESLEMIDRQADRVAAVVKRLLRFSRPPSPAKDEVDLNAALSEALSFRESGMVRSGIVLECSLLKRLPRIRAGYNELVHVFLNLVNNAIDAMPHGGKLRVTTALAGGWIETTVADTGRGIADEDLPGIFEPFFTTKPADRGTGLGLPISLATVRALGGEIRVESTAGVGTSFCVRLPVPGPGGPP